MTYANIKLQTHDVLDDNHQPTGEKYQSEIFETLVPLMDALAIKYPHWEFVEVDNRIMWDKNGGRSRAADGFKVYEKREELGHIRVDHWCRAGKRFWIDNFRIDAQKSRGSGYKTKHLDKAMKHIAKYFGTKDHTEVLEEAEKLAEHSRSAIYRELQREVQSRWGRLDAAAADFMMQNWGEFVAWLTPRATPALTEALNSYPEAYSNFEEARYINDLINKGKAWLVKISNSDYIVKQGEQVSVCDSDSLPAMVRRNLGLLKLVQDRQLISNVGIRINEETYYVLGDTHE